MSAEERRRISAFHFQIISGYFLNHERENNQKLKGRRQKRKNKKNYTFSFLKLHFLRSLSSSSILSFQYPFSVSFIHDSLITLSFQESPINPKIQSFSFLESPYVISLSFSTSSFMGAIFDGSLLFFLDTS